MNASIQNGELSERALAKLVGVSQPHLHNVLKGARSLHMPLADALLARYRITPWICLRKPNCRPIRLPTNYCRIPTSLPFPDPRAVYPGYANSPPQPPDLNVTNGKPANLSSRDGKLGNEPTRPNRATYVVFCL